MPLKYMVTLMQCSNLTMAFREITAGDALYARRMHGNLSKC